jgi:hypothetical protein
VVKEKQVAKLLADEMTLNPKETELTLHKIALESMMSDWRYLPLTLQIWHAVAKR